MPDTNFIVEAEKKSCDCALDLIKQFLTLSTAGLAFIVGLVFAKDGGQLSPCTVRWGLTLFGFSVFLGLLACMRMVGMLAREHRYHVYDFTLSLLVSSQILIFIAAVGVLAIATLHVASIRSGVAAPVASSPLVPPDRSATSAP